MEEIDWLCIRKSNGSGSRKFGTHHSIMFVSDRSDERGDWPAEFGKDKRMGRYLSRVVLCSTLLLTTACSEGGGESETAQDRSSARRVEPFDRMIRIRELQMGIGRHWDVCVDRTCYTSGPSEGRYRRDDTDSAWVLTNADGWRGLPQYDVPITATEARALNNLMSTQVSAGNNYLSRNRFANGAQNLAQYLLGGLCLGDVRSRMVMMLDDLERTRGSSTQIQQQRKRVGSFNGK
jgi:hypothetical protein